MGREERRIERRALALVTVDLERISIVMLAVGWMFCSCVEAFSVAMPCQVFDNSLCSKESNVGILLLLINCSLGSRNDTSQAVSLESAGDTGKTQGELSRVLDVERLTLAEGDAYQTTGQITN